MSCDQPTDPEDLDEVTALVNSAAADPSTDIEYQIHANERARQRNIDQGFVTNRVLVKGKAVRFETEVTKSGRTLYKYRFCYRDKEQGCCAIVRIVSTGAIYVITVFPMKSARK